MKPFALAAALALMAVPVLAAPAAVQVSGAWARPAAQGGNGVGYATVTSQGPADKLTGASSPAAQRVEIHESMVMDGKAMMHAHPDGVAVPAGGVLAFKPGGLHLMLIGLKAPLKAGDHVAVTLTFQKAGKITVDFPVQTTAP
ncbi:MAG: copper chaperone PCu(A)C [Caulobacter sp.]|nr:copper chaperone PCu(A)C [Caulobacter sp.]